MCATKLGARPTSRAVELEVADQLPIIRSGKTDPVQFTGRFKHFKTAPFLLTKMGVLKEDFSF